MVTNFVGDLRIVHSFTFLFDAGGEGERFHDVSVEFQENLKSGMKPNKEEIFFS